MKPEVRSLRKILGKYLLVNPSSSEATPPDFRFVHVFLAAKTVEHLMVTVAASSSALFLAANTLRLLTAEALEESSSEDEEQSKIALVSSKMEAGVFEEEERREELAHFRCVAQALEKALEIGLRLMKEGKDEEAKIDLGELDECQCSWHYSSTTERIASASLRLHPIDVEGIKDSLNNNKVKRKADEGSGGRLMRAHSFLRRILFGEKEDSPEGEKDHDKSEVFPVFKSSAVVKQLCFEDEEKEEGEKGPKEDEDEDSESFTSAVSSLEDEQSMGTPEELVNVYVNG